MTKTRAAQCNRILAVPTMTAAHDGASPKTSLTLVYHIGITSPLIECYFTLDNQYQRLQQ